MRATRTPSPSPSDLLCGHRATSRAWAARSRLSLYSPSVRSARARDEASRVSRCDRAPREDERRRRLERIRVSRFDYLYTAHLIRLTARLSRVERGVSSLFDRGVVVVRRGRRAATHVASGDVTMNPGRGDSSSLGRPFAPRAADEKVARATTRGLEARF